ARENTLESALLGIARRQLLGPGKRSGRIILCPLPRDVSGGAIPNSAGGEGRKHVRCLLRIFVCPSRQDGLQSVIVIWTVREIACPGESGFGIIVRPGGSDDLKSRVTTGTRRQLRSLLRRGERIGARPARENWPIVTLARIAGARK